MILFVFILLETSSACLQILSSVQIHRYFEMQVCDHYYCIVTALKAHEQQMLPETFQVHGTVTCMT